MGRFLQTDPIRYGDGANIYAYVHGDPVNGTDPNGTTTTVSPFVLMGSRPGPCQGNDVELGMFAGICPDPIAGGGSPDFGNIGPIGTPGPIDVSFNTQIEDAVKAKACAAINAAQKSKSWTDLGEALDKASTAEDVAKAVGDMAEATGGQNFSKVISSSLQGSTWAITGINALVQYRTDLQNGISQGAAAIGLFARVLTPIGGGAAGTALGILLAGGPEDPLSALTGAGFGLLGGWLGGQSADDAAKAAENSVEGCKNQGK